jgi:hypothetical protein
MIQQGQVFRLKAKGADGESLWAYRYRVAGRGSARLQVGGFSTRARDAAGAAEPVVETRASRARGNDHTRRVGRPVMGMSGTS